MMKKEKGGKRFGQTLKSLAIWQTLIKKTDDEHTLNAPEIAADLEYMEIPAEQRSVLRDINAIMDLTESEYAEDLSLSDYKIVYDGKNRGYKIVERPFKDDDIKFLIASIHASKFIPKEVENRLLKFIYGQCSDYQCDSLKYNAYVVDRNKTKNTLLTDNVSIIDRAIKEKKRIRFQYLHYTISDRENQVPKRQGKDYIASPYFIVVNEGAFYVLVLMRGRLYTYRIDRMKDIRIDDVARDGEEKMKDVDFKDYTRKSFLMFGGDEEYVTIRFDKKLLDTVIDKFGANGGTYVNTDEDHFTISAKVNVSEKLYAWICGFGKKAKIIAPASVVNEMKHYVSEINSNYD